LLPSGDRLLLAPALDGLEPRTLAGELPIALGLPGGLRGFAVAPGSLGFLRVEFAVSAFELPQPELHFRGGNLVPQRVSCASIG